MKVIRNLKGEIVRVETSYGEKWWHLSASTWMLILGLLLLIVAGFVPSETLAAVPRVFNIKLWPWELVVLIPTIACYSFGCWRIYRDRGEHDEVERKHAKNFIGFGATAVVILLCLLILSVTGRFFLFFRPVVDLFARGRLTFAAFWRLALIVVSVVPLIHFGKEWVCGFWDD
ncbi:MAG: hypothetical protein ACOX6D_03835 [Thermoguttaceae bacterium]|jgi:hypothetical protein